MRSDGHTIRFAPWWEITVLDSHPAVAVMVLTYNGRAFVEACLRSVLASSYPSFRVVAIDNGSTDGTPDMIRSKFPSVDVIRLSQNLGFSAGYNRAIALVPEEFVILLNQDAEVASRDWIEELVRVIQSDPECAVATCKIVFKDNPRILNSLGGMAYWWTGTVDIGFGERDTDDLPADFEPFSGTGGAMLVRRRPFSEVGGFDEAFFMYCEDFDLGWRLRLRGYRSLLAPKAKVSHEFSASLGRMSPTKVYWVHRNYLRSMLKNYQASSLARGLPQFLMFTAAKSLGLAMRQRSGELFWAPWRAVAWNIRLLRDTLTQRAEIQASRKVRDAAILKRMGPRGFEPIASIRRRLRISSQQ